MKYATLAMVATVAAKTAAPWAVVADHAKTCAALTKTETTALHAANLSKTLRAKALKEYADHVTTLTTATATAKTALTACWAVAPATVAADQVAPTKASSKCSADWNLWNTAVNAEWEAACNLKEAKADDSTKGGGATVGIIIGCVVGVCCIAGAAYYFCVHKKKAEAEGMYSDDLYEAFVDRETA